MNPKLKIFTWTLILVSVLQTIRFHYPEISVNQSIDRLLGLKIELLVSKTSKKNNGTDCTEILPLSKSGFPSTFYHIITDPNTVLIVSLKNRISNTYI